MAAQNCRKRKLDVLSSLEEEVFNLEQQKEQLMEEGADLAKERADTNDKVQQLYTQLFHTLRDDNGQPYDPNEFSLQVRSLPYFSSTVQLVVVKDPCSEKTLGTK